MADTPAGAGPSALVGYATGPWTAARAAALATYGRRLKLPVTATFADPPPLAGVPLATRPGGAGLLAAAGPGIAVAVPCVAAVADTWDAFFAACEAVCGRGAELHVLPPARTGGDGWAAIVTVSAIPALRAAVAVARAEASARRGRAIKAGIARARAAGRRHTRHAGYGLRWAGRRRVPDPRELAVIEHVRAWHAAGHSYPAIARHLARLGVRTAAVRAWSADRVRRAAVADRMEKSPGAYA